MGPALAATGQGVGSALKEGGRSATSGRGQNRMRSLLVIGEVALSLVLLVGAGLLARSFARMLEVKPGFDAAGVTMWMNFAGERHAEQGKRTQLRISFCREWRRCLASRAWRCRMICR